MILKFVFGFLLVFHITMLSSLRKKMHTAKGLLGTRKFQHQISVALVPNESELSFDDNGGGKRFPNP